MSIGVMKDQELNLRDLHVSDGIIKNTGDYPHFLTPFPPPKFSSLNWDEGQ
jgi:hypothetical protein